MRNRIAKRLLSLSLALVMVLGLLPAAAFAAYEDQEHIDLPPLGSRSYGPDSYNLRIVNLNKGVVTLNAAMHVGFPGNNVNTGDIIHRPLYSSSDTWKDAAFPHKSGTYYTSSGSVTRMESNPFYVTTGYLNGKPAVPVLAMVDHVYADRLLNLQDKLFDFKRWANDLMERDYDPASPQRGAMVSPNQFIENYEHKYDNFYSSLPVNILAYRDNVAPIEEGGNARDMSLVVGAVPYEANALAVEVTGTDYVPISTTMGKGALGAPYYQYTGPALVTVKVTNTASYPVLAQISSDSAKFIEIDGESQGDKTAEEWNPGHEYDRLVAYASGGAFEGIQYLPAGATVVGTIPIYSAPQPNDAYSEGRAFTKDVVSSIDITVKNVTNCLGSDGIPVSDKSVTVSHNTAWQGSGVDNPDYIPILYDYNPVYTVTPQVLDIDDIYDLKAPPGAWGENAAIHTPTTVTFTGPRLEDVTRVLAVVKLHDPGYSMTSSELPLTSDNITKGTSWNNYRQPRSAYGAREVVLTFALDGDYRYSSYNMVAFKENKDGSTQAYTGKELEAMTAQDLRAVLRTNAVTQEEHPFTYDGKELTLTLPEKYFTPELEQMHRQISQAAAKSGGLPEQIDFYFLTADDKAVVPTTMELPYWMAGEVNRPEFFKAQASHGPGGTDKLLAFDSYSLYNFRLLPKDPGYHMGLARKPSATIYIENSESKTYTTRFGHAFYLYQSESGSYGVSAEPRSGQVPLVAFTGSNLNVMRGSAGATSDQLGRSFDYFIPSGAMLNQKLLVRANGYASTGGQTSGIYAKNTGDGWEVWSEGCDILANGRAVMQDFQVLLKNGKKYSADYLGEEARKSYERVPILPFSWRGGQNVADSIPLIEGGFLNGDVHGGYLYKDSIGLDITIKDPSFLPLDLENIAGLGNVSFRAEVRLPSLSAGASTWEIRTEGVSEFKLGGANYVFFTAGANLEFEADTFRETPEEERFINISGDANLLDMLRMEVICNYKMVGNNYIFNKVYVSGGSDLIGLPPLVPILQISDVGGGIEGLADTLAHNDWNYIPPITLNLDASVALTVKILDISAEKAGVVVGLSKLGVYANSLAIKGNYGTGEDDNISVDLLQNLEISNSWDLKKTKELTLPFPVPVYQLYVQGGVDLLDFLEGTASLLVIVDTAELLDAAYKAANDEGVLTQFLAWKNKYEKTKVFDYAELANILGKSGVALLNQIFVSNQVFSVEGKAWGSVSIPSKVPILGGHELASGEAGISYYAPDLTLQVSGAYDLFIAKGEAGVVFTYNVKTGQHDTSLMSLDDAFGGGEDYTVTIEGLNFRDVPVVQVEVPLTRGPELPPEPETTTEPETVPEPETTAEPETIPEPEVTTEPENTPETEAIPQPETDPEVEVTVQPEEAPVLTAQQETAPQQTSAPTATPFATVEAFQIISQKGDDVVFVEFLASEPVGITITSPEAEGKITYTIKDTVQTPESKTPGWVPVYEDDSKTEAGAMYYRYTFQFYEPNGADATGKSIHGKDAEKKGGYTWTATTTDPNDKDKLTACNVATIEPPEEISDAEVSSDDVTFTAANLKDGEKYTASVSLVHKDDYNGGKPTSEGTPVGQLTSVAASSNTIPLNANYAELVQSGEYYAVVHLEREDTIGDGETKTVRLGTSAISGNTLTVLNPKAPGAIDGEITHEYAGNGAQRFTFPAADAKTTGYELTATDSGGNPIMVSYLDKEGKQIAGKTVDAFAAPGTYPLKDMQENGTQLTMVPDGSRLVLEKTYQLTFTPYHEDSDGKRFYGPAQTIQVEFVKPKPVTAVVSVDSDIWKRLDPQADLITRYVAQERLVTMETENQKVGDPKTAGITFSVIGVRSIKIVAMGDGFAERDEPGNVTNNKTKIVDVADLYGAEYSHGFYIPLSAGEHTFTVTTVSAAGDANTQVFVFTVDGADIQFTVDSHSFDPGKTLGSENGQSFTFEALLEDGAKVTQIGTISGLNLTPSDGKVSWTDDPKVKPTVLAMEGTGDEAKAIAWRYTVPITVKDANGFTAVRALSYEVFDPAADVNFPSRLELAVTPGARLNTGVADGKVSVTAVTASGTVAVDSSKVTFASSDTAVLDVAADGTITVRGEGTATITATYKLSKDKFTPRGALPVSVVSLAEKPTPALRVVSVTADSITVELGPVNAASVTLSLANSNQSASLTTGLDGSQFYTFSGLDEGSDYEITATPEGNYYAAASVRATTDLPVPAGQIYTVTYAQDGADSGSAPIDPNRYAKGDEVKLLVSATPLTKNGAEVLGFSTAPNGGSARYLYADMTQAEPHTFAMGEADVTLYPIWPASGSSGSSGSSGKPQPTFPGGKGWDGVETALKDLPQGGTLTVDMNGATTLPADVLEAIAGKDVTLELDMGGGAVWVIQGGDVPATGLSDLNLGVNTKANTIPVTVIDAATGEQATLQVELSHSGPFGLTLTLRLSVGTAHAGRWANLYYYDPAGKTLDFRAHSLVGGQGWAELPFDHASSYAVVIDDAPHGPWENPFTDVAESDWFYEAVRYVHLGGLFSGTSETAFSPNVSMSRAMLWTVLARLDGQDTQGGATWYEKGRAWAIAQNITDGTDPEGMVTREQVAVMLYRYAALRGLDVSGSADLTAFSDGARVSSWAVEALAWANAAGIVTGKPGNLLAPQGQATRAEAATMLMRCAFPLSG